MVLSRILIHPQLSHVGHLIPLCNLTVTNCYVNTRYGITPLLAGTILIVLSTRARPTKVPATQSKLKLIQNRNARSTNTSRNIRRQPKKLTSFFIIDLHNKLNAQHYHGEEKLDENRLFNYVVIVELYHFCEKVDRIVKRNEIVAENHWHYYSHQF